MSMSFRISAFPWILAVLTACAGGGGGGGSVTEPSEVPFSSFSAVAPEQTVVMSGVSQTGSGTASAFSLHSADTSQSTARLSFDAEGKLSSLSLAAPRSSVSFGAGDVINCSSGAGCGAANSAATASAALINPYAMGWNYQTFGVWMKEVGPSSFQAGAMSAGAATPGAALPNLASATFSGHASGFYLDGTGGQFATDAQMRAITDFSNRRIEFSTTGTLLTNLADPHGPRTTSSGLDLSGTLNYAPGVNQFSGNVSTRNGALGGAAVGRFYGPNAEEMGGTYGLGSSGAQRMLGAFGAKR